ncbi:MAG: NAD(P)H-hydrate dehydratase [Bacteroidetes bacterium]|nr:NAD(P)H-hydrate dehydratase [Bacteroidota bacterium]
MKIFTVEQIRRLDEYTIQHEPIASIDLMERAARAFCNWFVKQLPDRNRQVFVFCGPGNNGGDGFAIARMLGRDFYEVKAFLLKTSGTMSRDCQENFEKIRFGACAFEEINASSSFPDLPPGSIVIDAIFGSGLSRPVERYWADFIKHLNQLPVKRVSVDIPSGMFADKPTTGTSFCAHFTFSFEMPKLGFLFSENFSRVGSWSYGSIGLDRNFIQNEPTPWHLLDKKMVKPIIHQRKSHDHKGTFGHALLVAGSYGKIGAAILAARACLRSGAGLVTVHAPKCAYEILQIAFPEAMVSVDEHQFAVTEVHEDLSKYKAIGIGCGLGTNELTAHGLADFLEKTTIPIVLDADGLNLLAGHPDLFRLIPKNSILTPHPKEFERMFGQSSDDFSRNELQRLKAQELGIYLLMKGANTAVACPDGTCFFNSTGNPGMATGGSGDVLTGILTGLLAQGYTPLETCLLGVYLHGLAGDLAMKDLQQEALLASDITDHFGKAFIQLKTAA